MDNGEFFIRSSGSPFTFTSSSFSTSDFFPGNHSADYNIIFSGPSQTSQALTHTLSSGIADQVNSEGELIYDDDEDDDRNQQRTDPESDGDLNHTYSVTEEIDQSSSGGTSLGQLRHTRDKLRLEIPTISLSDASRNMTGSRESCENGLDAYNGQDFTLSLNMNRTEPEVSEVWVYSGLETC